MLYWFPSDARELLTPVRGHRIAVVRRQVLLSDYNELPASTRDEESDGPTELIFDNGIALHFTPDTEQTSVKIGLGRMPRWGEHFRTIEPAANEFWSQRLGSPIREIFGLVSTHAEPNNRSEFAVELQLETGLRVVVEYISDETHQDTLRISGDVPTGNYRRVKL